MKRYAIGLLAVMLGVTVARAQTNAVPTLVSEPQAVASRDLSHHLSLASLEPKPLPVEGTRVFIGGAVVTVSSMRQPLQFLNPLAPPEYGDGTENLAINPSSGQAEGVTLFSIGWFTKGEKERVRRQRQSATARSARGE